MMAPGAPPVVLASTSPTRRALLSAAGVPFSVQAPEVDEATIKRALWDRQADPAETALSLADAKAHAIQPLGTLVIAADQLLVCDGQWFDKPMDLTEARQQLLTLRARTHTLVTAAVCWRDGAPVWHRVTAPTLTMRAFSPAFLDRYLAGEGDAVLGSVGCYRMEGLGAQLFSAVTGEHAAILGLPMLDLLAFLRDAGVLLA